MMYYGIILHIFFMIRYNHMLFLQKYSPIPRFQDILPRKLLKQAELSSSFLKPPDVDFQKTDTLVSYF